jgi:hypothetical protein
MRVKLYKNLRRNCYSVMSRGKVIRHEAYMVLTNVKFNVRPKGRDRVRSEKRKNVHAFVEGEMEQEWPDSMDFNKAVRVSYNPYVNDSFVDESGVPIFSAKFAVLNPKGCWISSDDAAIAHWNAICEMGAEPVA